MPAARSYYRGLRVTITQSPDGDKPCFVSLSTKQAQGRWDDWSLMFPSIRVPVDPNDNGSYQSILRLLVRAVEELLKVDAQHK